MLAPKTKDNALWAFLCSNMGIILSYSNPAFAGGRLLAVCYIDAKISGWYVSFGLLLPMLAVRRSATGNVCRLHGLIGCAVRCGVNNCVAVQHQCVLPTLR